MATWQGWEQALLEYIGAPVTQANIDFLDAWQSYEGGSATYNPLNTTQSAPGATVYNTFGNGYHVWNYPSITAGIQATAQTLQNGYYPAVFAALKTGNPSSGDIGAMQSEIHTWGTNGFANNLYSFFGQPSPSGSTPSSSGGSQSSSSSGSSSSDSSSDSGTQFTGIFGGVQKALVGFGVIVGEGGILLLAGGLFVGSLIFLALQNKDVQDIAKTGAKAAIAG